MRILLIRLSALGDVVTASPVPRVIKQAQPDAEVVWIVEERCAAAVQGHPCVDEVIVVPTSRQWGRWLGRGRLDTAGSQLWDALRALRRRPFDVVLDLQGLLKSATLAWLARAERKILPADATERLPWFHPEFVARHTDPAHIATMYTSLLAPLGIQPQSREALRLVFPVTGAARETVAMWLRARGLRPGEFVAAIPGTTRPQKMWPTAYWPALLAALHCDQGLPAVVVGGPAERALAQTIASEVTTPVWSAAGEFGLTETAALLEAARLTVGVDTGPMHMAVAVGCPTVSLFGSTGPRRFTDGSPYVCLHREFACWPCHRHPTCRHYDCLRAIRPGEVARVAAELLRPGSPEPAGVARA